MTPRQLRKQREIGPRLAVGGRDAHQPGKRQRRCADQIEEARQLVDRDAAFLLLGADVHLDKTGESARPCRRPGQRLEQ